MSSWSLAGRLTRLFLLTATLFVLVVAGASAWFLHLAVEHELEALLHEEFDEAELALARSGPGPRPELLGAALEGLALHHPENPLAWRVWGPDGERLLDLGPVELLEPDLPAPRPEGVPGRASNGRRWMTRRLEGGLLVGLVVDGSHQIALLGRYGVAVAALALLGLGTVALGGRILFGRVAGLLERVARSVRDIRRPEGGVELELAGAPREVREIVDALEEMLANFRREIEQARLFAAGMAHELRSPVQNLIGETEVALLAGRSAEAYRAVLESNLEELAGLSDAINNLIGVCSIGTSRALGPREVFDVGEEAGIRLRRERLAAERAGVRLEVSHQGDLRVLGDREALTRGLRNLVANAVEWTPAGGVVRVALRGEAEQLVITVDDDGPGVPPELRERVFEPFFRAPRPAGQAGRLGYGLGLGLVRAAALAHGGSVDVSRSPSGGARFRLVLPREPAASAHAPGADGRASAPLPAEGAFGKR
jgi:two-component system heavy metal sensor histidine kinase CusS